MIKTTAQAILDFWFLPVGDPGHHHYRAEWFRKDDAFDASIRAQFAADIMAALAGKRFDNDDVPSRLAEILLLDQFTRNIFRDTPHAFAGDAQALALANDLMNNGLDLTLPPFMRWFAYLPFEHSESLADQEHAVALFTRLRTDTQDNAFDAALDYAIRHRDVVARFGRFPHRNAVLGRTSTRAEIDFLQQPGSSF